MNKIIQLGNLVQNSKNFTNPQRGRVYSVNGIAPTISTCQGGQGEPKVIVKVDNVNKDIINIKHTEIPCFYDDRDKTWGGKNNGFMSYTKSE